MPRCGPKPKLPDLTKIPDNFPASRKRLTFLGFQSPCSCSITIAAVKATRSCAGRAGLPPVNAPPKALGEIRVSLAARAMWGRSPSATASLRRLNMGFSISALWRGSDSKNYYGIPVLLFLSELFCQ